MVVEKRPDREARNAVEHKNEVRVLKGRVVPGIEQVAIQPLGAHSPGWTQFITIIGALVEQFQDVFNSRWPRTVAGPGRRNRQRERVLRRFVGQ
jgi:hypothetical protein